MVFAVNFGWIVGLQGTKFPVLSFLYRAIPSLSGSSFSRFLLLFYLVSIALDGLCDFCALRLGILGAPRNSYKMKKAPAKRASAAQKKKPPAMKASAAQKKKPMVAAIDP